MCIVVTGGFGFIGSALIRHIISSSDETIVNIDSCTYAASPDALGEHLNSPRHIHVPANICDSDAVRSVFAQRKPSRVIHLAAETHVDRSIDGPSAFISTNVVGTQILLDAAREYWLGLPAAQKDSFLFHHVSTDEVFGSLSERDAAFTETTAYSPRSPYSASKAASDHLVRAWNHTYGLPALVTNTSNNYGPWQFPEKLIPLTILNALAGKPLPVYGTGENVRDWIHVEDHARGLFLALMNGQAGATYCFGARQERSNLQVVHAICDTLDRLVPDPAGSRRRLIQFVHDRPGHDFRYAIDSTLAETTFGWKPARGFEAGLEETIEWYRASPQWWKKILEQKYAGERLGGGTVSPKNKDEKK